MSEGMEIRSGLVVVKNLPLVAWLIRAKNRRPVQVRRGKRGGEWLFEGEGLQPCMDEYRGETCVVLRGVLEEIKLQKEQLEYL